MPTNHLGRLCAAATLVFTSVVLAQQPGQTIEAFKASLDPRVFQTGGNGNWESPLGPHLTLQLQTLKCHASCCSPWATSAARSRTAATSPRWSTATVSWPSARTPGAASRWTWRRSFWVLPPTPLRSIPPEHRRGGSRPRRLARELKIDRATGLDAGYPSWCASPAWPTPDRQYLRRRGLCPPGNGLAVTQLLRRDVQLPGPEGRARPRLASCPRTSSFRPTTARAVWNAAASCNYYQRHPRQRRHRRPHRPRAATRAASRGSRTATRASRPNTWWPTTAASPRWSAKTRPPGMPGCYNSRSIGIEHEG